MRKEHYWNEGGLALKTTHLSARKGDSLFADLGEAAAREILCETFIKVDSEWVSLGNDDAINAHVRDAFSVLPPKTMLQLVMNEVCDFNFAFLINWKSVTVPGRFHGEEGRSVASKTVSPMLATIVNGGRATLRELEEYYSFQDAMEMADLMTADTVNRLLAQEQAQREANKR